MDSSLEDLTAQLQAAQERKSVVRLSERNVVELVNKLKEMGYLDKSLLHTINGKEYLTREKLKTEIQQALYSAGGRISIPDVSNSVNVDLGHCERQSNQLLVESKGEILLLQSELITQGYLDSLAQEINERLHTTGMLRIGDLAIQYGLNQDALMSAVQSRLGRLIEGELLNRMLYTQAYMDRIRAQLRGALRGCTSPIMVPSLLSIIHLENTAATDIIQKLLLGLVADKSVKGELGSNGQWTPEVHLKAQRSSVASVFTQAGWISLAAVRKVSDSVDSFVSEQFREYLKLDSVVVSLSFIESFDADLEEALEESLDEKEYIDAVELLPVDFTVEDARLILNESHYLKSHPAHHIMAQSCVVPQSFKQEMIERSKEAAVELAKEAVAAKRREGSSSQSNPGSSKKDDEVTAGKKKGKGKKGKTKQSGKETTDASEGHGKSSPSGLTLAILSKLVSEWYPSIEINALLVEEFAELTLPHAQAAYDSTFDEATKSTDVRRQSLKDSSLKNLELTISKFWLYSKGLEVLEKELEESAIANLRKYLIKATGGDCMDYLIRYFQLQEPGGDESIPDSLIPIQPNERQKVIESLAPDMSAGATAMAKAIKQDDPAIVMEAIDSCMESCGIRPPKRDKKTEKQKTVELRELWISHLKQEEDPASSLATILPLLALKLKGIAINIPGKLMPIILEILKPLMKPEDYELIESFHKAVVDYLMLRSSQGDQNVEGIDEGLIDMLGKAKTLVTSTT